MDGAGSIFQVRDDCTVWISRGVVSRGLRFMKQPERESEPESADMFIRAFLYVWDLSCFSWRKSVGESWIMQRVSTQSQFTVVC
jgi:hypothetical protein